MALTAGTIFQIQATATTGNVNGAGFNPANANFPTDLVGTSATTASPVVSSATYAFVAGDVNNWVYIKSGTNWTPGWYQIASVSGGSATLNAAVGAVVLKIGPTGVLTRNSSVGCATTSAPTAGTYGVDYSQTDTANSSITDAASVGASTTLTSLTAPWTPVSVGNFFHLTTTGTGAFGVVGWYEIVSYVAVGQVTTDRTTNSGTALVSGTGQTGGAGRLNGLEDIFKTMIPAASIVWVGSGTYTFSGASATASANSTAINPSFFIGYTLVRGDICNGNNRPIWVLGANAFTGCVNVQHFNINGTTTTSLGFNFQGTVLNCKILNSSSTSGRAAIAAAVVVASELICQNGSGVLTGSTPVRAYGCYFHDSADGYQDTNLNSTAVLVGNIFESCTFAISTLGGNPTHLANNVFYGSEAKTGTGVNFVTANATQSYLLNNIFYGLATGIAVATGPGNSNLSQYNDFFNNTTDVTNWTKDITDVAINPNFVGMSQIVGTTATSSGSVLTDTSQGFSGVNDGVDFLRVFSGTGATVARYLIISHTATTITVNNAIGTSTLGNIVYSISNGHNFTPGSSIVGIGFPNFINTTGGKTTSFPTIGAVIPAAGSGASGGTPILQSAIIQGCGVI